MVGPEKFKAWQEKYTIKPANKQLKKVSKKIMLKN